MCRNHEKSLLPLLRKHDMHYVVYSPLAEDFLNDIFTQGINVTETRFEKSNPIDEFYKRMYNKKIMHDAIRKLQKDCESHDLKLSDSALRWLFHHFMLIADDEIILSASKENQMRQNVNALFKKLLSNDLVELFELMWNEVESVTSWLRFQIIYSQL